MSKRQYERLTFEKAADPRLLMTASGSKAQWDGLTSRKLVWEPNDLVYQQVMQALESGDHVNVIRKRLGISYKVFKAIGEHALGVDGFRALGRQRKVEAARRMVQQAQLGSRLEDLLATEIEQAGLSIVARNAWSTLVVAGVLTHREADIKVAVGDGRKIVVLCDGEVFHGPKALYVDPVARTNDDVATADAFFAAGYSVVRYSESEIHAGFAARHLEGLLDRLKSVQRVCRLWHPAQEHEVTI